MLKLSTDKLTELFSSISKNDMLYMPVEQGGQVQYGEWTKDAKVCLDKVNTVKSAKDVFLPQTENIVAFKTEGKNISIIEDRDKVKPFAMFGVRACDAASFKILDKVYLAEPVDTFYKVRRDNGVVITLACSEPEETCFCNVFGIDAENPSGDIETWITDGTLYWNSLTEKGNKLTESIKNLFEEADSNDEAKLNEHKDSVKKIIDNLPLHDLSLKDFNGDEMNEKFNSPKWEELSKACVGCGACTFICPTCQCFDIRDYDTGHGIQRFRCWDSCMYSEFTKMAAANPRLTQMQRFRQRFMHKLVYFPANNDGLYGCVGCGRCISKCPVSMNITKVIKALGGDKNE